MVKTVNGVIVIDGCKDLNCGNNCHPNNEATPTTPIITTTSDHEESKPLIPTVSVKSDEDPIEELATSPCLFDDDHGDNDGNSSSSSSSSDKENEPPLRRPNYWFAQKIIEKFQYFMMESVKDCFQNLIQIMKYFQFACVHYDILTFFYSAEELLSLDNVTMNQHFRIRDQLYYLKESQFKNKLLMCLRILKEMLEEERDDFLNSNINNPNSIQVELSLGTFENTTLFIRKIRNLLRNGRHLKYSSMTWHDRVVALFEDLNRLNRESHIHFRVENYLSDDFEEYTQFKKYTLLTDEEYERYLRENSPEY